MPLPIQKAAHVQSGLPALFDIAFCPISCAHRNWPQTQRPCRPHTQRPWRSRPDQAPSQTAAAVLAPPARGDRHPARNRSAFAERIPTGLGKRILAPMPHHAWQSRINGLSVVVEEPRRQKSAQSSQRISLTHRNKKRTMHPTRDGFGTSDSVPDLSTGFPPLVKRTAPV